METKELIEQLEWWAEECDRTNHGCQARKILQEAADALDKLKKCRHECKIDCLLEEYEKKKDELEKVRRERDAAIKDWKGFCTKCDWNGKQWERLKEYEDAGAVPVVRCGECLNHIHEDDVDFLCTRTGFYTRHDDFCSYGERRKTEDGPEES